MLAKTIVVLVAVCAVLLLLLGPWDGADSSGQAAAEPVGVPASLTPDDPDTVALERPDLAAGLGERTERVVESSHPGVPRTFACALTGRFLDTQGKPLSGVRSALGGNVAKSGRDGRFLLELALPLNQRDGAKTLDASLEGYVARRLEFVAKEQVELGDVMLALGGSLSGRVVDADGNGFAGAEVLVTGVVQAAFASRESRPSEVSQESLADNSGTFLLTGVAAGDVRLWAGAPGMRWAYTDDLRVQPGEEIRDIVLRLEPRAARDEITLLVLDPGGEPVPRAHINYSYRGEGRSGSGNGTADEEGRYRYPIQYEATYDFMARDPEDRYRPASARKVPAGATDRILQLGEARELAILVRGEGGEPVREFTASCQSWIEDRPLSGQRAEPADDVVTPGRAVIQLPLEPFDITVAAAGYQNSTVARIDPGTVGPSIDVVLTSLPGVKGRVVDGEGRPLKGVRVGLHKAVAADSSLEVNGFPCRSDKGPSSNAATDAQGEFDITLRKEGSFYLRASLEGLAPGEIGPFDLAPDLAADGLEVVLREGGSLVGSVIVPVGESPAGRIVGISRADGFGVTARADADGRYEFTRLTPGRWLVRGRRDEISPHSTTSSQGSAEESESLPWSCTVTEGKVTRFDLDLTRSGVVVLEGSFRFSGVPAAGCEVTLNQPPSYRTVAKDVVDPQGKFRLELDDPGAYRLQIAGQWEDSPMFFAILELELHEGTQAWSRDLPTGRIEGSTPSIAGDRLSYSWEGDEELSLFFGFEPSESGTFSLPVPAGAATLKRSSQASAETSQEIEVPAGGTLRVDLR